MKVLVLSIYFSAANGLRLDCIRFKIEMVNSGLRKILHFILRMIILAGAHIVASIEIHDEIHWRNELNASNQIRIL